jgi:hypothetical protein
MFISTFLQSIVELDVEELDCRPSALPQLSDLSGSEIISLRGAGSRSENNTDLASDSKVLRKSLSVPVRPNIVQYINNP